MIDKSRYEGHTPGPWYFYDNGLRTQSGNELILGANWEYDEGPTLIHTRDANDNLISDAPLLLAEVERLEYALFVAKQALDVLQKLSNGSQVGNSIGNQVACCAIAQIEKMMGE